MDLDDQILFKESMLDEINYVVSEEAAAPLDDTQWYQGKFHLDYNSGGD